MTGAVVAEGRERSIWVNAADEPARCDFILPAVIRRGRLVVAVSTGGASPAAARAIREELEGYLTEDHATLVDMAADAREDLRRRARPLARPAGTARSTAACAGSSPTSAIVRRAPGWRGISSRPDGRLMREGRVYLVGAGPGDPGLMTVRGLDLLRSADVVVYDRLVNPVLLDEAPAAALRVFAGKRAAATVSPRARSTPG